MVPGSYNISQVMLDAKNRCVVALVTLIDLALPPGIASEE